jgi:RNA polymerase sigma-70 factor (ECF subfamily)
MAQQACVSAALVHLLDADAELMLRLQQGELACLGWLLERHRAPLAHFLCRMVQNQAVAEELAQDVFFRVYRSRAQYRPTARFSCWLYRIATNLALNWLRDHRHERNLESLQAVPAHAPPRQLADRRPTIDQAMLRQARLVEVRRAVAALPDMQRAVVLMHKYGEMEYSEIAQALGCSTPSVKSRLFRAYSTLRTRLAHLNGA